MRVHSIHMIHCNQMVYKGENKNWVPSYSLIVRGIQRLCILAYLHVLKVKIISHYKIIFSSIVSFYIVDSSISFYISMELIFFIIEAGLEQPILWQKTNKQQTNNVLVTNFFGYLEHGLRRKIFK